MSILLNPKKYRDRGYPDERSKEIMLKTIEWFEKKGLAKQKEAYHNREWCEDWQKFVTEERIFETIFLPKAMEMIRTSITVHIEIMNFLKSADSTAEHTGIHTTYQLSALTLFSSEIMKRQNIRLQQNLSRTLSAHSDFLKKNMALTYTLLK
jgi:hypothetical protein